MNRKQNVSGLLALLVVLLFFCLSFAASADGALSPDPKDQSDREKETMELSRMITSEPIRQNEEKTETVVPEAVSTEMKLTETGFPDTGQSEPGVSVTEALEAIISENESSERVRFETPEPATADPEIEVAAREGTEKEGFSNADPEIEGSARGDLDIERLSSEGLEIEEFVNEEAKTGKSEINDSEDEMREEGPTPEAVPSEGGNCVLSIEGSIHDVASGQSYPLGIRITGLLEGRKAVVTVVSVDLTLDNCAVPIYLDRNELVFLSDGIQYVVFKVGSTEGITLAGIYSGSINTYVIEYDLKDEDNLTGEDDLTGEQ